MKSSWTADPKERLGWLSPGGKFYPCKHGEHQSTADEIWRQGEAQQPYRGNSIDPLYGRGWRSLHNDGDVRGDFDLPLTQPQIDFLGDLAGKIREVEGDKSHWARKLDEVIEENDA